MKIIISIAFMILGLGFFYSCKSTKNASSTDHAELQYFELRKGACRGKCTRYTFITDAEGNASLKGKKNIDWIGDYTIKLDEADLRELKNKITLLNLDQLDDEYIKEGIKDLQITTIKYNDKVIRFHKRKAPEEILLFVKSLEQSINQWKWEE